MVHVALQVLAAAFELVLLAVHQVLGDLFALLVDFVVEVDDFFLEDELGVFVVDWVVVGAYFDFVGGDLHDDVGFEHQLDVGELGVVFLLRVVALVVLDVDEELHVALGGLDGLGQFLLDVFEEDAALLAAFLLEAERWVADPAHDVLLEVSSLLVLVAVALLHEFLVLQCFQLAEVQLECVRVLLLLLFRLVLEILGQLRKLQV